MKYTLKIHEPCHENWAKMTPAEQGKFCDVCQKNVYDFTQSSATEINKFVKKNSNFCGRLTTQQLEKEYNTQEYSGINYKKVGAFLGITSALTFAEPTQAQEPIIVGKPAVIEVPKDTLNEKKIRGYVCFNNEPYSNVKVTIPALGLTTFTDAKGYYSFDYKKIDNLKNIEIQFEIYGMETKIISVSDFYQSIDIDLSTNIQPIESCMMVKMTSTVGLIAVIKKPSLFKRFLNLFKRKK